MPGEIRMFGGNYPPIGFMLCDGGPRRISAYPDLFKVIGTRYGGDGVSTFAPPNLGARVPIHIGSGPGLSPRAIGEIGGQEQVALSTVQMAAHAHQMSGGEAPATDRAPSGTSGLAESQGRIYAPAGSAVAMSTSSVSITGSAAPHDNLQPFQALNYVIGYKVTRDYEDYEWVGEIRMFTGNFVPRGWFSCDGQSVSVTQNPALFSVLGFMYGGDGRTAFLLPDLRGRVAKCAGFNTDPLTPVYLGDSGGSATAALTTDNLPAHTHGVTASSVVALSNDPAGKTLGVPFSGDNLYAPPAAQPAGLAAALIGTGGGQPHNNMQPYLVVNFIICLQGVWPGNDSDG